VEITNARLSDRREDYAEYLYARLQRRGFLHRDCMRLVNTDRNHFAACMVALGDADALVTGITRNYSTVLEDLRRCIDPKPGHRIVGVSIVISRGRTVVVADTAVHDMPNSEEIADIAEERPAWRGGSASRHASRCWPIPPSAIHPVSGPRRSEAVRILDSRHVDFEYDGEMGADVALNPDVMAAFPFCRLSGPANVLVMPARHSAAISTKMLQELGGTTVLGPLLVGFDRPVQILPISARDADIANMAALAAYNISG
jgi:malate dehydrogenase (oxaloacetate-decarboxylating)(NADP+)